MLESLLQLLCKISIEKKRNKYLNLVQPLSKYLISTSLSNLYNFYTQKVQNNNINNTKKFLVKFLENVDKTCTQHSTNNIRCHSGTKINLVVSDAQHLHSILLNQESSTSQRFQTFKCRVVIISSRLIKTFIWKFRDHQSLCDAKWDQICVRVECAQFSFWIFRYFRYSRYSYIQYSSIFNNIQFRIGQKLKSLSRMWFNLFGNYGMNGFLLRCLDVCNKWLRHNTHQKIF